MIPSCDHKRDVEYISRPGASQERFALDSQVLSLLSHELRTPLNAIIGFADILSAEGALEETQRREFASYISEGGSELLTKISTMLVLARIQAGTYTLSREILNPFSLAQECCEDLFDGPIHIEPGDIAASRLCADRSALTLVLRNLLSNAHKFSGDNGELSVVVKEQGDGIEFVIEDDGCGIEPGFLETAGKPFRGGDMSYGRVSQGMGLGLAVVKGLVNLHHGKFSLTSTQHVGTTASVWLPSGMTAQGNMFELV